MCSLAFGLRLGATAVVQGFSTPPDASANPDQLHYEAQAFQLSQGNGYVRSSGEPTTRFPPGTSFFLSPVYAVFGHSYAVGRIWFCLLSALTCGLLAWVGLQLFGPTTALVAALWLAVTLSHVAYAPHFVSEVPYAFALVLACGCALSSLADLSSAGQPSRYSILLSGMAGGMFGVATLVRPQAVFILPLAWLVCGLYVYWYWSQHQFSTRLTSLFSEPFSQLFLRLFPRLFLRLTVASLCMSLIVGVWVVRNVIVTGKPVIAASGGTAFWAAHNERSFTDRRYRGSAVPLRELPQLQDSVGLNEIERDAVFWRNGWQEVWANWQRLPELIVWKVWRLCAPFPETSHGLVSWAFALAWVWTAPLSGLGLVWAWRRFPPEDGHKIWVVFLPVLALLLCSLVFHGSIRYRHSLEPLFVLFGAYGLVGLLSHWVQLPFQNDSPTSFTSLALTQQPQPRSLVV